MIDSSRFLKESSESGGSFNPLATNIDDEVDSLDYKLLNGIRILYLKEFPEPTVQPKPSTIFMCFDYSCGGTNEDVLSIVFQNDTREPTLVGRNTMTTRGTFPRSTDRSSSLSTCMVEMNASQLFASEKHRLID